MQKTITLAVPNELWVDDFSNGDVQDFTYDGPDTVWLTHTDAGGLLGYVTEEPVSGNSHRVDIASASDEEVAAAIIATQQADAYEYTYEDELNHDGSIYKRISNPRVSDFYTVKVLAGSVSLDVFTKDKTHHNMSVAVERKKYVQDRANAFSFDDADQQLIDGFLSDIDGYIETISTAYPWKFVVVDKAEVPKIPVALVKIFNQLPSPIV